MVEWLLANDIHTGVRLRNQGDPILNVANPDGIDSEAQLATLDVVNKLNKQRLAMIGDPEISTRIANYEMAFRLQSSAPNLMNLKDESAETIAMYGCEPDKPSFARACLLARRMVQRGVRFINIYHEGWDAHSDVVGNHIGNLKATEQATVALVQDLKRLGMLDSTLVIWGGEFGRTPMIESNASFGRCQWTRSPSPGIHDVDGGWWHQSWFSIRQDPTISGSTSLRFPFIRMTCKRPFCIA